MDLNELRLSVGEMSQEELLDLLQTIRANRRKPVDKPKPARKAKQTNSMKKTMQKLTSDDIAKLIEVLS